MGQYQVITPCVIVVNGRAVVHRRTGVLVTLDDDIAAQHSDSLRPIRSGPVNPAVAPQTDSAPMGQPPTFVVPETLTPEPESAEGATGTVLDDVVVDDVTPPDGDVDLLEPEEPSIVESPKPGSRRSKRGSSGQD